MLSFPAKQFFTSCAALRSAADLAIDHLPAALAVDTMKHLWPCFIYQLDDEHSATFHCS